MKQVLCRRGESGQDALPLISKHVKEDKRWTQQTRRPHQTWLWWHFCVCCSVVDEPLWILYSTDPDNVSWWAWESLLNVAERPPSLFDSDTHFVLSRVYLTVLHHLALPRKFGVLSRLHGQWRVQTAIPLDHCRSATWCGDLRVLGHRDHFYDSTGVPFCRTLSTNQPKLTTGRLPCSWVLSMQTKKIQDEQKTADKVRKTLFQGCASWTWTGWLTTTISQRCRDAVRSVQRQDIVQPEEITS